MNLGLSFFKYRLIRNTFFIMLLVIVVLVIPYTYSRYESIVNSQVQTEVAYYLLDASPISGTIRIDNLVPSDEPYVYNFSISNNNGANRTEINLEYNLSIKATTNLPLTFELYLNEDYSNPLSTDIIDENLTVTDEDGVYFKNMTTATEEFSYNIDQTNEYTLLVYFPSTYSSYEYQGIVESIDILINSKQIIE